MTDTQGFLILPQQLIKYRQLKDQSYKLTKKQKIKDSVMSHVFEGYPFWKFASVLTSGRPGPTFHLSLKNIVFVTLLEEFTQQKRWYKALVNIKTLSGSTKMETLYFFADPWILQRLLSDNHNGTAD